jgi:hypothetical protein
LVTAEGVIGVLEDYLLVDICADLVRLSMHLYGDMKTLLDCWIDIEGKLLAAYESSNRICDWRLKFCL